MVILYITTIYNWSSLELWFGQVFGQVPKWKYRQIPFENYKVTAWVCRVQFEKKKLSFNLNFLCEKALQVLKQQTETQEKYLPTVKQEIRTSHQKCWKEWDSWYYFYLCLCQHCRVSDIGKNILGWCKHRSTSREGRAGIWAATETWPLQINGPWRYPPECFKRPGWCHCEATLHNLWEIVEIREQPETYGKTKGTLFLQEGLKSSNFSLTFFPGKINEQFVLRGLICERKHISGKSQHGFTNRSFQSYDAIVI